MRQVLSATTTGAAVGIISAAVLFLTLLFGSASIAAVITDGSLGPAAALSGPDYNITADLGQLRGDNLFHSFSAFDLNAGESAAFGGPGNVTNIIARVTSGDPSLIDGTLRSTIAGADLFLLNPSGIFFGPDAVLDVGGSFHASTADNLRFEDGTQFAAVPRPGDVLSAARPEAFGFLTPHPADISVDGSQLAVPAGETLSLTAGNLRIRGESRRAALTAPGGKIALTGVGAAGEIRPDAPEVLSPVDDHSGEIKISNTNFFIDGQFPEQVIIKGGWIEISEARVTAKNSGSQDAVAPAIDVAAASRITLKDNAWLESIFAGSGKGGDIRIAAQNLKIENNGRIYTLTEDVGQGGDIEVDVVDEISIDGSNLSLEDHTTGIYSESAGEAAAGGISISTDLLTQVGGGQIVSVSFGTGDSGGLSITAGTIVLGDSHIFTIVRESGVGKAGDIVMAADNMALTNSYISTPSVGDISGEAGDIHIALRESLNLTNSYIGADAYQHRNGGEIHIEASTILLQDNSAISSSTLDGNGGNIFIKADTLSLKSQSLIASTNGGSGNGSGGIIDVICTGDVSLDASLIRADAFGTGQGGNIHIRADRVDFQNGALIDAKIMGAGDGGNIEIEAAELIRIDTSSLEAEARGGPDTKGGSIQISAPLVILEDGKLIAKATEGRGGDITIKSKVYLADRRSVLDASSDLGIDGRLDVQAPLGDLSSTLTPFDMQFLDAVDLLKEPCDTRIRRGDYGSFVVKNRDALPLSPNALQMSPLPEI